MLVHNKCETWNEFQAENAGKYTNEEMSAAWAEYKAKNGIVSVPSEASADKLRRNMINANIQEPTYQNAAHHIVAGNARDASEARQILDNFKININDAANGVFLPTEIGVSNAAYHPSLHTTNYYDKVNALLRNATSKQDAIDILGQISKALQNGSF